MQVSKLIPLVLSFGCAISCGAAFFNFDDSSSFPGDWVETAFSAPNAFAHTSDGGVAGSGAVYNPTEDTAYYTYIYPTPVGQFAVGEIGAMVHYVDKPDNHSGNPFVLGLTVSPDAFIDFGGAGDDYIKLIFNNRTSDLTQVRPEIYGTLNGQVVRTGVGHPETYVRFVNNAWYHVKLRILKTESGEWNLEAVWDLYNADGTVLVQAEYAKHDYISIRASDPSPVATRPALEQVIGPLASADNLYLFIGGQGLGARGVKAVDNVSVEIGGAANDWYGYTVDEAGWVDTGSWLGWVNITFDPWVWTESLTKYVYLNGDSGWVWVTR